MYLISKKRIREKNCREKYTFDDIVPVKISDGNCTVDFRKVYSKMEHFFN